MGERRLALVTGDVPEYRLAPYRELADREQADVVAFGTVAPGAAFPVRRVRQRDVPRLVGEYRAVICSLGGRVALPSAFLASRRARIPFVLWATIWAHPRTAAHALSWLPTRHLYRAADAVVTYGPHVSRHVERHRTAGNVFVAPQAVDPDLFAAPVPADRVAAMRRRAKAEDGQPLVAFVGRHVHEKGVEVLAAAWERANLRGEAALASAGAGPLRALGTPLGQVPWRELPGLYAAADVLVLPSISTRTFTEPWGLVINEAMHQGTPVIASDAVGAVAGGLVRDGVNGLVFPAGDADALAERLRSLVGDADLRARMGAAARRDVAPHTPRAWAEGVSRALAATGTSMRS